MSSATYLPIPQHIRDIERFDNVLEREVKIAALNVSAAVVGLQSTTGGANLFTCTGTIVECKSDGGDDTYMISILTTASLVRHPSELVVAPDIEVHVRLHNGNIYFGEVALVDFHYNVAVVQIMCSVPLMSAKVKSLSDWSPILGVFSTFPSQEDKVKLCPEDKVIALARFYVNNVFRIQPGALSAKCCQWDCKELLIATCKVYQAFIGGPIINFNGEIIGLNFGYQREAFFLPMNIAMRCLEHLWTRRDVHRPEHGMTVANLYLTDLEILDVVVRRFPYVCGGVMVEKVEAQSSAYRAGFHHGDIIIQCAGDTIKCSMEFFEKMWDKAGDTIEMVVITLKGELSKLSLTVEDVDIEKYNSWPIPKLQGYGKSDISQPPLHKCLKLLEYNESSLS